MPGAGDSDTLFPPKTIIGRFGCVRTRLSHETAHPMPSVTFDGQSFTVRNRKVWLVAAGLEYALTPRSRWAASLAAARRAGFNTIVTSAPWGLHEPSPDRFDFADGLDVAAGYGIRAVIQPGGSMRDAEVIAAADEHGMAMVLTGMRHFRH